MAQFEVLISRTAVENATLLVEAESQDEAENKVADVLDQPHRVELVEIRNAPWLLGVGTVFIADDESPWEIC